MKLNNILKNINLKKVVPIALITIVILVVTISLMTCGKKDNKTKNNGKEVETNDTVKETTDNNEGNGSIFDYLDEDYTSDDKNSLTVDDNQTGDSNTTGSTSNNEQSTKKPSSSDKTTTSNIGNKPGNNQITTNNNSGNNNNNSNNNNNNQQQTDNDIVEVGYGLYDVKEDIREDAENFYCRTVEYYAWYEKYADGTVNMNKDRNYMLPQSLDDFTYATRDYEYGVLYEFSIFDYYYYKYDGAYTKPTNAKAKELYNKYYRDEFATKEVLEGENYHIFCHYYVDKKSNKAFRYYNELVMERVASDAVESLGSASSSMSKEKKICLITNYINSNTSIKDVTEKATTIVNALNKSGVKTHLTELKDEYSIIMLVQMEDGLWYEFDVDYEGLTLDYCIASDFKSVPNGAVFATQSTSRLAFPRTYPNETNNYFIAFSDITY
ncbi:MAG: hypothetical protein U0L79_07730 [Lachnospiraceae bacterium]|nr:hypothetical protein [Lachnospiraceae bacterium]